MNDAGTPGTPGSPGTPSSPVTPSSTGESGGNVTADEARDDWAWRRKLRSNPHSHRIYRIVVGVVGLVIVVGGLALVPLPGPGWVIVFVGLAVWASEFAWAQRLLHFARMTLQGWTEWLLRQPWWMKALVTLATLALLAGIFWVLFKLTGVPGFFPDAIEGWMKDHLALD